MAAPILVVAVLYGTAVVAHTYTDDLLVEAVARHDFQLSQLLLELGASPDARIVVDSNGTPGMPVRYRSALATATADGGTRLVKLLLDTGANVNARGMDSGDEVGDDFVCAPSITWAAIHHNVATFRLLVSRGADPCSKDNFGHTPIELARQRGDSQAIKMIQQLKAGC